MPATPGHTLFTLIPGGAAHRLVLLRGDLLQEVGDGLAGRAGEAEGREEGQRLLAGAVVHDLNEGRERNGANQTSLVGGCAAY